MSSRSSSPSSGPANIRRRGQSASAIDATWEPYRRDSWINADGNLIGRNWYWWSVFILVSIVEVAFFFMVQQFDMYLQWSLARLQLLPDLTYHTETLTYGFNGRFIFQISMLLSMKPHGVHLGGLGLRFQLDFELEVIHQSTFEIQDLWGTPVRLGWFGRERGMMGRGVWILWMGQVGFVIYKNVLYSSLAAHRQEHKVTQPFPIIWRDGSPYNPGPLCSLVWKPRFWHHPKRHPFHHQVTPKSAIAKSPEAVVGWPFFIKAVTTPQKLT